MISYYLHKVLHVLLSAIAVRLVNGAIRIPAGYRHQKPHPTPIREVILGFWDMGLMHLGDQLFHLGTVRALQSAGIRVTIQGSTPLAPLLTVIGVTAHTGEAGPDTLIITKKDMLWQSVRRYPKAQALCLSYKSLTGMRVADFIFQETKAVVDLDTPPPGAWALPSLALPEPIAVELEGPAEYLVFNDAVASNFAQVRKQRKLLYAAAIAMKQQYGLRIVYVGSMRELRRPAPLFIDLDLRGKVSPVELIALLQHSSVRGSLSFDTFIAHAACLCSKQASIVPRHASWRRWIAESFFPMSTTAPQSRIEII